ncbi:MAG: histidine phosphatase family protein [Burkholderiaceae bacterium]|nr:histidine phosphatase family protein [Burkholderiaceae bacterium]
MGHLYLVRHGQASFGADNYDQLSDLGTQQSQRLGAYFSAKGLQFDTVVTGSLARHSQTWAGIEQGLGLGPASVSVQVEPGLNEYDSHAVINAINPGPLPSIGEPGAYQTYFRLLRDGLRAWMDGVLTPAGMPSYETFRNDIVDALKRVRDNNVGKRVLVVSSGGPISTTVGYLLGTPAETTIELNYQIRNTALSEFKITSKGLRLVSFNGLPHLDRIGDEALHTHT